MKTWWNRLAVWWWNLRALEAARTQAEQRARHHRDRADAYEHELWQAEQTVADLRAEAKAADELCQEADRLRVAALTEKAQALVTLGRLSGRLNELDHLADEMPDELSVRVRRLTRPHAERAS
ncbi:hypothetical protein [Polymorphospora lycopeni]|uniref:Uncharacterized protein n=1 Tax=Polymorphospora lycopeni TaxID=3140240 RepID=A0ABV5CL65_9ACTN